MKKNGTHLIYLPMLYLWNMCYFCNLCYQRKHVASTYCSPYYYYYYSSDNLILLLTPIVVSTDFILGFSIKMIISQRSYLIAVGRGRSLLSEFMLIDCLFPEMKHAWANNCSSHSLCFVPYLICISPIRCLI